jgi:ketosteroid isomerase-like protein
MSLKNVQAVRATLDGWNRGDVDAWLRSAHPEIEWFSEVARLMAGPETVYRGVAGMRRYWEEWRSVWDATIELSEIHDLGDTVVAIGRVRARGEASGIDLERPVAFVFGFEGDLARTVRSYVDPQEALDAASQS